MRYFISQREAESPIISILRRRWRTVVAFGLAALLAGCLGYLTPAYEIGTNTATLTGYGQCLNNTPNDQCAYWWQYWADGDQKTTITPYYYYNSTAATGSVATSLTGLQPGTLYHNIFCGYGDTGSNGIPSSNWQCTGPLSAGQFYGSPVMHPNLQYLTCLQQDMGNSDPDCQYLLTSAATDIMNLAGSADMSLTGNFRTGVPANGSVPAITGTADIGRVLSTSDTPATPLSRDTGISVVYAPGQALWLFGDVTQVTANGTNFIQGDTAAFGSFTAGQAPQMLSETPVPGTPGWPNPGPNPVVRFLPLPTGIVIPGTTNSCGTSPNYIGPWGNGAVVEPSSGKVLITMLEECVQSALGFTPEGFGLVEWNPTNNTFTNGTSISTVFKNTTSGLPAQKQLGHPIMGSDGYIYFFSSDFNFLGHPGKNAVYLARIQQSGWATGTNYQFWSDPNGTGGSWTTAAGQATSLIPFGNSIISWAVSVGDFSATTSHTYVMLVKTGAGSLAIYEATSPSGPWTGGPIVVLPDVCNANNQNGCYAIEGHPELSSNGNLVYSYFSQDDQSGNGTGKGPPTNPITPYYAIGHIRLGTIAW